MSFARKEYLDIVPVRALGENLALSFTRLILSVPTCVPADIPEYSH